MMKEITKVKAIEELCKGYSVFLGVSHKAHADDEIALAVDNLEKAMRSGEMVCHRSARPFSKGVEFSGGSYCEINDKRTKCFSDGKALKLVKNDGEGNFWLEMYYYLVK